ncbi:MAG: hypothetical protein EA401_13050 [Planctomycetota bacterium]|nr:MAG: hypothetical protein EA401_13050 [Planctomycetota bacterium]
MLAQINLIPFLVLFLAIPIALTAQELQHAEQASLVDTAIQEPQKNGEGEKRSTTDSDDDLDEQGHESHPESASESQEQRQIEQAVASKNQESTPMLADPFAGGGFDADHSDVEWVYAGYVSDGQRSLGLIVHKNGSYRFLRMDQSLRLGGEPWRVVQLQARSITLRNDFGETKELQ